MSEHTGDPLRGDAEFVTGGTDSSVPQSQAPAQVAAAGQAQPGPTGEQAPGESPAPMVVLPPAEAQAPEALEAQAPEALGAQPLDAVQPPEAVQPPDAAGPPHMPEGALPQPQGPPGELQPPGDPWAPPPGTGPGTVPEQPRKSRWRRITVMTLLLVIGLGAVGAGGSLLFLEETRHATAAEANAAGQQELASLWQRMTIGQIFPKTATYGTTGGISAKATLIGIAPQSSCAAAADPTVARALTRSGCVAMLRATYADQSGTILATVGIAVMRSTSGAQHILNAIAIQGQSAGEKTGILAVGFPGTAFPGSAREVFGSEVAQGPYLFFYTAGYADGRSTSMQQGNGESITTDLGSGVMNTLSIPFTAPAKPCASKDISC